MEERYAADCLGWLLVRVLHRQGMTADRLAQHLDLTPAALAVLARCRVPPVRSVGFERRLDVLATTGAPLATHLHLSRGRSGDPTSLMNRSRG